MNYKIIKLYTEKLNIYSFRQPINGDDIELGVTFSTSLISVEDDIYLFKVDYNTRSMNKPISLSWTGICVLQFSEKIKEKINLSLLLENEEIKNFIDESIEKFSFFIGGDLPKLDSIKGNKKHD